MTGARGAIVACLTAALLLLIPASASACPTKRHISRHHHEIIIDETCTDNFTQPAACPGNGKKVTLFADEGIKKMAQSIKPSLSFPAGGCPNATLSGEKFTLGATTNPNGTPVTNKPGEQTGQYVWTWTGNGAGGQFVSVRVVIDYQDPPIGALKLSKFAEMFVPGELRFHTISHVHLHSVFSYVLDVFNPNSAPAQIHIRDPLPEGWRSEGLPSAPWAGGGCRLDHDILFCHDTVAPKGHPEFRVPGEFRMPGERVNVATAYGTCDGVELPAVKAERSLRVLPQRR